jgi:hypothetical protein
MAGRLVKVIGGLRSRRVAGAAGAIGAVALFTGVIVGAGLPGSSKGASQAKASGAATVQRRDLVSTDTESGTLGYAHPQTVYNRVGGTITWLPSVGHEVKPGGTLYRVDNSPVILFDGTTPAYRTLSSGVTNGPDVQELNGNLVALGFDPSHEITVDDTWQTGTTDAVNRWQAALGQTQTGTVTLGQVVFLPGPQLVTTVETVLGSTGASAASSASGSSSSGSSGSGSSGAGTGAVYIGSGSHAEFVSLSSTTRKPATAPPGPNGPTGPGKNSPNTSAAQLRALIALLKAEVAELKSKSASSGPGASSASSGGGGSGGSGSGGSSSGSGSAGGGSGASAGSAAGGSSTGASSGSASATPILQTTSVQEVVTVNLDATKQTEAVVGEPVSVQLPNGNTVNGKITQVSPVAQSSSSSSGSGSSGSGGGSSSSSTPSATIPVTITLTGNSHVSGLDQAAVSVNFAQQKARNVLSVPVTALIATQGGGYAVQEATSPHTLVPVTPGLFAAGYVQISGSGVYPGLQVTDSQG